MWDTVLDIFRHLPARRFRWPGWRSPESLRRKLWIAGVLFIVVLLFAPGSSNLKPGTGQLYVDFVMFSSSLLVLGLAMVMIVQPAAGDRQPHDLCAGDRRFRSLEIMLGRIVGFVGFGTLLLIGMAFVSLISCTAGSITGTTSIPPICNWFASEPSAGTTSKCFAAILRRR